MGDLLNLGCGCCEEGCEGFNCSNGPLEIDGIEVIPTGATNGDCTCPQGGTFLFAESIQNVAGDCARCAEPVNTECGPLPDDEGDCSLDGRHSTLPSDFDGPCVSGYSYYIYATVSCCNWKTWYMWAFSESVCARLSGIGGANLNMTYSILGSKGLYLGWTTNTAHYRRLVVVTNSGPAANPYLCRFTHSWGGSWELDPAYPSDVECPVEFDIGDGTNGTQIDNTQFHLTVEHAIQVVDCSDALGTVTVDEMSADQWNLDIIEEDFGAFYPCNQNPSFPDFPGCDVLNIDIDVDLSCLPTSVQLGGIGTAGP